MKPPKPVRVLGKHDDWTVEVQGFPNRLAVIHSVWWSPKSRLYRDPHAGTNRDGKRFRDYYDALERNDVVVMQETAKIGDFAGLSYIGLFRTKGLALSEDGAVSLEIVERLPLKPV
jgi:hypothetical protein